ncbi:uncharacterized protein LOC143563460 [Bidens hawaiensis]|uniref:uncharacterized protein LOC143563460 n=1 Tax=Bidens hawaiensis TaxID=980011 RepID=UPI00404A684D
MASSSNYSINEGSQHEYPYPSHVNVANFVSIKLSGENNYATWRAQMLCLLDSHDMLGFIDGTLEEPRETSSSKATIENIIAFLSMYREWRRSDTLVKGWIFGSLSEDVLRAVADLNLARQVWNKLEGAYDGKIYLRGVTREAIEEEVDHYIPLCRAIQMGDWEKTKEFFDNDNRALTDKININGYRTLHVAIGNPGNIWLLEKLLELIDPDSLPTLVSDLQRNALHLAAILDSIDAARILVEKNPHLLFCEDYQQHLPVQNAINNSHRKTFLYLLQMSKQHLSLSKKEGYHNPFEGRGGVLLLNQTIIAGFLDIAYELLKEYPELASRKEHGVPSSLLVNSIASDAYPSGQQYNFYQRFVYSYVPTKDYDLGGTYTIPDVENQEPYCANPLTSMKSYIYIVINITFTTTIFFLVVINRIYAKFWEAALVRVPHIKHLHDDKVKHNYALAILKFICEEVSKLESGYREHYHMGFITAVKNNTHEVIRQIIQTFPHSIWNVDLFGYKLSQLSIMHRCENVYNVLVHEVTQDKYLLTLTKDRHNNNLLHLAGQLAPVDKLSVVTGFALQMQRELQWFQEVRKLIRPKDQVAINNSQETPIMVFRREHQDLRQKGEEWMKKTADSYTITAALIITIAFAAAIIVPGGNNQDTGKAVFETRIDFIIFVVSDAISLFTSTTSLLLFLSILTARYAEEDFLYKLPNMLIFGLMMLFISVTSMLIAFSATLYIMFEQQKSWIMFPIAALTCLPIDSFVTLQLPLLVDLISSTYAPGIFGKRSELRITS